ncbi:MAG: WD40/YVTN/BNR-like repeat-containing protein, partial [Terriglobales bacterium]
QATQFSPSLLGGLEWRDLGPMRGGRAVAVAGAPSQPDTFYFGSVGGGVWKSENAGRTWTPIFDAEPVQSIGAIAVAPSDPNIVYVGTGEADIRSQTSYGDGMYKSTDAGRTWRRIGLEATRRIGRIVVDPNNPNRVYVAALGHAYDANPERGLYRSLDGGVNWEKILDHGPNVGAIDISLDVHAPRTLYVSLWATRRPPWNVYAPSNMPGSGLYKTTDGGDHWVQLKGGLPTDDAVGKIGVAVAPSNPRRVWAVVDDLSEQGKFGGVYLSDDAGASWRQVNTETRLWGRGWYFEAVTVDPENPDKAYVINTSTYVTTNAGRTFTPIKGAPGGDDYHQLWVNPRDANRMVLSSDQGTVVSVDDARTWSSWYNQPTAEVYHVSADNRFPWWVYGAQQDSGAVGVSTWSNQGVISFRNWLPLCTGGESGMVAPDPKDGNILFGGAGQRCNQELNIADSLGAIPRPAEGEPGYRKTWTLPLVFSAADQALYYGNQYVFRTRDGGRTWERISPDLTREDPGVPANLDAVTARDEDNPGVTTRKGVVYSIAPSPLQAGTIWAGTDDGSIQLTTDGGQNWSNVTPPALTAWSKVSGLEASHFDAATAYAAVDRHRLGDLAPYLYRTRDGGKSWQAIAAGIPDGSYVNAVKEDTVRRGLLFAGTELGVYVSFNDGDEWQPLQLNLPRTSARDFAVHGDALVVATHGRGFWVLDDISPLRQLSAEVASAPAYFYQPSEALAVRQGSMNGTPLPPEEPQNANPPAGAILYYNLSAAATTPVVLEVQNASGATIATLRSDEPVPAVDVEAINIPAHWIVPPLRLGTDAGLHRFVWDLRMAPAARGRG